MVRDESKSWMLDEGFYLSTRECLVLVDPQRVTMLKTWWEGAINLITWRLEFSQRTPDVKADETGNGKEKGNQRRDLLLLSVEGTINEF